MAPPDVRSALDLLGLPPTADLAQVRTAFRRKVAAAHPDRSDSPDAGRRVHELVEAYAVLRETLRDGAPPDRSAPGPPDDEGDGVEVVEVEAIRVDLVDVDTLAVDAPADTTLHLLVDAAHDLGDIVYLDPDAGLVEVVVEFVEAPRSSLLMTLQGRANGTTEVMCTVEPLSGGESPPTAAVVRLLAATLRTAAGSGPPEPA